LLPRIIHHSSAVIVNSESTRQDVHSFYGVALSKLHVVYAAVNHDVLTNSSGTPEMIKRKYDLDRYVLIVGATYPHKNIEKAIEAFARVRSDVCRMQLVIAGGRHEYVDTLRVRAASLGMEDIRFLGYVPSGDMAGLYAGAQVLLYPSLYEGFGLPPLEAMACGCPVITSQISSLPEVCGDAAFYIDPYQVDNIAETLLHVLNDQDLRAHLRRTGFQQVQRYSWSVTARDIYRVLCMAAST
jgi:glycosyltransferase involved in cell wall biosynthesis